MPISTGTFSVASNYRLELSLNIVGQSATGFSLQYELGLRLLSGAGGSGVLNLDVGSQWVVSGTGSGATTTFPYSVSPSAPYAVLDSRIINASEVAMATNGRTLRATGQSTVANANALGTTVQLSAQVTMPAASQATWPSFTPSTFDAGTAITISLPRQVGTYTHDLLYTFGSIVDSSIATGVGITYSYTPPLSLISEIPTASEGPYTITAITRTSAGAEVGRRSYTGTLRVPAASAPTVTAYSATDTNTSVATLVGAYVEDLSVIQLASVTATASGGATIDDRRLEIEGASLRVGDSRALLNSGTIPVTAAAWDSRGARGSLSSSINVLAYTGPQNFSRVFRSTAGGVADDQGASLSVALPGTAIKSLVNGTERNQMTIRISTRPFAGGTWTVRNSVTPTTSLVAGYLTYNGTIVVGGGAIYAPANSYSVRVEVLDRFNVATVEHTASTAYVTVDMNGSAVGIGKMHERGMLDVAGPGHFRGLYTTLETIADANLAAYGGSWDVTSSTTTNLPSGLSGQGTLTVRRSAVVPGLDLLAQSVQDLAGRRSWRRNGGFDTGTGTILPFDAWVLDTAEGYIVGTSTERGAIPSGSLYPGLKFYETDTSIEWIRRGSAWFISPGQLLGIMEFGTNVTGAAGTQVGTTVSTPVLPIGQAVKVAASYSQYQSGSTGANFSTLQARNNASDVTYATYDKRSGARGYSFATSGVNDSMTPVLFLTTTAAAKVSAALYIAAANTGVFGADGITVWIESA